MSEGEGARDLLVVHEDGAVHPARDHGGGAERLHGDVGRLILDVSPGPPLEEIHVGFLAGDLPFEADVDEVVRHQAVERRGVPGEERRGEALLKGGHIILTGAERAEEHEDRGQVEHVGSSASERAPESQVEAP